MATFLLRVWLPDRPGALGAIASRIGAVRGDVVGIDILERGGGRVIDELVVELPSDDLVRLLLQEIANVDGVDVEDIRRVDGGVSDRLLDALETADRLVAETDRELLCRALVDHILHDVEADWVALVHDGGGVVAVVGQAAPEPAWLAAFVAGAATAGEAGPSDVAWAPMARSGLVIVLGRDGWAFRDRERRQAAALARIADTRLAELA